MNYNDIKSQIDEIDAKIADYKSQIDSKVEEIYENHEHIFELLKGDLELLGQQYKKYYEEIRKKTEKENEAIIRLYEQRNKIIEEDIKDEKKRNELQKEFDKEKIDQLKKTLAYENLTIFEQLNMRFENEKKEYKKHELDTLELEKAYNKKRRQLFLQQSQQLVGAISNLVNAGEAQVKDIADSWAVINQGAHDYGRVVGLTASQIQNLNEKTLSFWSDNDITYKFNVGLDEFYKIMGAYNKELGRAVALTNDSMLNLVSMKNVLGEEQAIKFTANLDKFGLDVDAAKELVEGIVGDARRSGIVLSNLTQNVADNLHLAQQYTFEDGIEGLVKMAEKASAVKWNMQQTAAFAEKVNNIEGAIKTGAQLSVLGGPFAQFSNPMGMLYESLNDMEGLQDRIFAMFGSLGEWNQEKGMLDVSAFNKQRIRAAASAMGLNYGDVMNTVQSQARRNVVIEQIKNYGLDENTTELIANTAQIDRETGRAYVNYEGKKIFANEIRGHKDKDKILKYLETQANSQNENLRDIAQNTLGAKELIDAAVKEVMVDKADMVEYMGVTKNSLQDAVYAIEASKAVLNQINIVLNGIQSIVGVIAATSAFKGVFGGGMGNAGARGLGGARGFGGNTMINGGTFGKLGSYSNAKNIVERYGSAKAARGAIRRANLKAGATGLGIGALGIGGMVTGHLMSAQSQRLRDEGNHKDADNVNLAGGALSGAMSGAAMGAMFGPWGVLIGGVVGGIGGGVMSAIQNNEYKKEEKRRKDAEWVEKAVAEKDEKKQKEINDLKEEFYEKTGLELKGDYTEEFIKTLFKGKDQLSHTHRNTLEANGDIDVWNNLHPYSFAAGGILKGSSHAEGGMNVVDNKTGSLVAEIEGDEGIIPKNIMKKFGTVGNLINKAMRPLQPMGEIMSVDANNNTYLNSSLNVGGSASVNVGGSIQLSMPNGQNYNIAEDPAAMRMIGDNVMRHIMSANQQIFNKAEFYRKW